MLKLVYHLVFTGICFSLGCNMYFHKDKRSLSKSQYLEAHSGLFTHESFYTNRKFRDIHNHNISWDTLSGIVVWELINLEKYSREGQKARLCSSCGETIFVTDTFMSENIIDTLSFAGLKDPISFRDTVCTITKKWTSRGGSTNCDFSQDSLVMPVLRYYRNETDHRDKIDILFRNPKNSTSSEYIYEPPKQRGGGHESYYIVYAVQVIGMSAWNVEAADFFNENIRGGISYPANYMEEEAHKLYPKKCWYNRYYPPSDFFRMYVFDTICPIPDKYLKKLALKKSEVTHFIPTS